MSLFDDLLDVAIRAAAETQEPDPKHSAHVSRILAADPDVDREEREAFLAATVGVVDRRGKLAG